jgi:hypothetical protein
VLFTLGLQTEKQITASFGWTSWRMHINHGQFFQAHQSSKVVEIDVEVD